tara:strand:+ start:64 stop:426 length:363 start_codon:yes stop_codon:yes gene_type:complete
MKSNRYLLQRRKTRNRSFLKKKLNGKLRLSVFRSNNHIYCQIIDDIEMKTLLSSSTLDSNVKKKLKSSGTVEAALEVGKDIAEKALKSGHKSVVFDRGGYLYHGRVKSLADGAREKGLKF